MSYRFEGDPVRYLDAMLVLALAAKLHTTDEAVRAAASRVAKRIERRHRADIYAIVNSTQPRLLVIRIISTIPDFIFRMNPAPQPAPTVRNRA
jgi:hypothetical protein